MDIRRSKPGNALPYLQLTLFTALSFNGCAPTLPVYEPAPSVISQPLVRQSPLTQQEAWRVVGKAFRNLETFHEVDYLPEPTHFEFKGNRILEETYTVPLTESDPITCVRMLNYQLRIGLEEELEKSPPTPVSFETSPAILAIVCPSFQMLDTSQKRLLVYAYVRGIESLCLGNELSKEVTDLDVFAQLVYLRNKPSIIHSDSETLRVTGPKRDVDTIVQNKYEPKHTWESKD